MDDRKAQVRQYISDLRSFTKQPDAILRNDRGMASAIRVEASVCQVARRKGPDREAQSSTGAIPLNVIKQPHPPEMMGLSF